MWQTLDGRGEGSTMGRRFCTSNGVVLGRESAGDPLCAHLLIIIDSKLTDKEYERELEREKVCESVSVDVAVDVSSEMARALKKFSAEELFRENA
jgi:hypothetical protein